MNDRLRQKEKLFHPHKVVIALPEECKGYMDATKEQMRNWWHISRFHHMKLNKKVLGKMMKRYGCKELGYGIDWYDGEGLGQCCGTESSDDVGDDDTSVRTILRIVKHTIREMRPYLKNPERVFWWKQEDCFKIYIFLRDTHFQYDFMIWSMTREKHIY